MSEATRLNCPWCDSELLPEVETAAHQCSNGHRAVQADGKWYALRVILGQDFASALRQAGVIRMTDLPRRIVIDAAQDEPVVIYMERWGDNRLLQVATSLQGVEIRVSERKEDQ